VPHIVFDYHQECRGGNSTALNKLKNKLEQASYGYFGLFYGSAEDTVKEQCGTIRTNCVDCLDRTNSVQTLIGLEVLNEQIKVIGLDEKKQNFSRFEEVFRQMWM
jgi:hypothetical protein